MNKRLTIYMTYNKNGIIDDYIVYMLKQLVNVSSDIIVVSNKKLKQREKEKIAFVSEYIERGNEKFDVGAYSQVIKELYDKRQIYEYDELVLINDSVFGPFFDLNDMFSAMDRRKGLDFGELPKEADLILMVELEFIQNIFKAIFMLLEKVLFHRMHLRNTGSK